MTLDREGRRLMAGNSTPGVWDVVTGKELFRFESNGAQFTTLQFSPDNSRIATTDDSGQAQFWDSRTGAPVGSPMLHNVSVTSAQFTPDGRLMTYAADGAIRMWARDTGEPLGEPMQNLTGGTARLSADASRIVAGSADGSARVWDVASGLPVAEPMRHGEPVTRADFSPDGRFVRTVTTGATAWKNHLWSVPPPLPPGQKTPRWLIDLAAIYAGRALNDEGNLVPAPEVAGGMDQLRRTIEELDDDAPYAEWGKWLIADPAKRSIAPGFTITPAEADKLAASPP